jgi:hypothetical protein
MDLSFSYREFYKDSECQIFNGIILCNYKATIIFPSFLVSIKEPIFHAFIGANHSNA